MTRNPEYEVTVVGAGPAGVTTALYATRLGHRTALVDAGGGRHAAVDSVHNVAGVSEATSGAQLSRAAVDQFVEYGGDHYRDAVESVTPADGEAGDGGRRFRVAAERADLSTERVVLATGFTDRPPAVPELRRFTGRGLHYCLHCDAYSLADGRVFVLGHGDEAAHAAMLMLNFTPDVELLLDGRDPDWSDGVERQVRRHPVDVVEGTVEAAFADEDGGADGEPWLGGLEFEGGTVREYVGGFAMYGLEYNNRLARELGCELREDGAVAVDEDRRTSVDGVYAVGDLTHGQNQTAIAMGDGAYAGIALHKDLRTFPIPPEELPADGVDPADVPATADDLRARMRRIRETGAESGLRPPGDG